jgi:hypothetical protein
MTSPTRRAFLGWLAAAIPVVAVVRSAHAAAIADLSADPRTLRALADTVLPAELGRAGIDAQVADFQKWIAGYREGAELLHGYGTSALERARPTPATRWMQQLDQLDTAAHKRTGRAFADVSLTQRRALVEAALASHTRTSLPSMTGAPHIALALLSYFYQSSEANDLCYESQIGKERCRPLAQSSRKPLPLAHKVS